jgi:hypothetical protein
LIGEEARPISDLACARRRVVVTGPEQQMQVDLDAVGPECELAPRIRRRQSFGLLEQLERTFALAELERSTRRRQHCVDALADVRCLGRQQEPPPERVRVLPELGGERNQLPSERLRGLDKVCVVGDPAEHRQTFVAQQAPLRRAHDPQTEFDRRQPCVHTVLECFHELRDIRSRLPLEPLGQPPVQRSPPVGSKTGRNRLAHEVVSTPDRVLLDHDPSCDGGR